ncbi:MAG: SDR family oxidoreductase [Candidatus Helarchaeota archaeon]|nr:SDR family oxidoreductase [Candidatus Helarchaeota archaeon]
MFNVIITGSTKGFGFALARKFLEFKDSVIISSRNKERVENSVSKLKNLFPDGQVLGTTCDVTKLEDVKALGQFAIENLESIDIWINNAGITSDYLPLVELTEKNVKSVIETNLLGTLYGCQVALKIMLRQNSGKIFNIEGLGSDKYVIANLLPYITSKAAIPNLTKALKLEIKGTKVQVHNISPGMMVTELVVKNLTQEPKIINILAETPKTVADYMVPKMRKIKGNGKKIKFLKGWKVAFKFMTAWRYKDRFMDKNGNLLIDLE